MSPITAVVSPPKNPARVSGEHGWAQRISKRFLMSAGGVNSASGQYRYLFSRNKGVSHAASDKGRKRGRAGRIRWVPQPCVSPAFLFAPLSLGPRGPGAQGASPTPPLLVAGPITRVARSGEIQKEEFYVWPPWGQAGTEPACRVCVCVCVFVCVSGEIEKPALCLAIWGPGRDGDNLQSVWCVCVCVCVCACVPRRDGDTQCVCVRQAETETTYNVCLGWGVYVVCVYVCAKAETEKPTE